MQITRILVYCCVSLFYFSIVYTAPVISGVRLAGGNGPWEGTVEVNVDGSWGTICNHNFDLSDARVICRMLGFKREIHIWGVTALGQGTEKILLTDLSCTGYELNVGSCGYHTTYCRQNQAIGISCVSTNRSEITEGIRLIGGTGPYEGTIELNVNGEWGTICSKQFDINDANVICRMAGFTRAIQAFGYPYFGKGNGTSMLSNVHCSGSENNIDSCGSDGWYRSSCSHDRDAGVACLSSDRQNIIQGVKLVGGNSPFEGRVELNLNGQWGTICGKTKFDINAADVICRMAGYSRSLQHFSFSHFGEGNGSIVLSNPQCSGKEDIIDDCGSNGWYYSGSCTHYNDVGVICKRNLTSRFTTEGIRLVGGAGPFEGRVEININGQWGTICDTDFDLADAEVLCRMAGYSRALQRFFGAYFGEGNGRVFLDHLRCSGKEQHLDSCPSSGLFLTSCQHSHDIGVSCQRKPGQFTTEGIRLVGGAGSFEGRVELNINGQWGTICDTNFDLADAGVLCRMAGYSRALQRFFGAHFGEGTGPVFLDHLGCSGNEQHVDSCPSSGLLVTSCQHSHDIGVSCQRKPGKFMTEGIRLVNGPGPFEGRVEISVNGQWGTICDKQFGLADAEVVCRMAGYSRALQAFVGGSYGEGTGPVFLENLGCNGNEKHLDSCYSNGLFATSCRHSQDVGVACLSGNSTDVVQGIRFVDGPGAFEGRVEISVNGQWGTICDKQFGLADAEVLCRMAGYSRALQAFVGGSYGEGTGPVFLQNVGCKGNEKHLDSCYSNGLFVTSCSHSQDVGVACLSGNSTDVVQGVRLVNGSKHWEGRVELQVNGQWGTICGFNNRFDLNDATVVCRMAGFSTTGKIQAFRSAHFGQGTGRILIGGGLYCVGNEVHIDSCLSSGWYVVSSYCDHQYDVGVSCPVGAALGPAFG